MPCKDKVRKEGGKLESETASKGIRRGGAMEWNRGAQVRRRTEYGVLNFGKW